ncbi:Teichoic acid export ATP-binding protein TagH [Thioalkalivibrio nitratireducens DSM 14787]|uniref:Teichoic acid export ATP-binding protein TagH n=1 Tax=Thioalkalivibrio nitratireducens (strain DSM 14787 / UNIQEM 213 / ALEN2) TaxID=1255043 RepID=L0DVD8_THIND|nr:ABC transporter ATP-binding protein [Thioalkalivibrio nitratireducens]AGA33569.1 Teichoic acid export ATP-binding protein TagH [Thioalkalivibrio nitratireducens DSM 14787]
MTAIRLRGAGRSYALYERPLDRLLEVVTQRPRHREVAALRPVDLDVSPGQVLGLVGNNGAGKSTLLKLVAGTLTPSSGTVEVNGTVGALLELGGGFHPEMSGRDNVFLKGAIMGVGRDAMRERYAEITEFAGLGKFIDQPVKTYSSGMFMRLAFAVATCIEPDVLLIDEALSVGDGAFARKSFDRIMQFKNGGRTIVFCSHSLYQVEAICDRVIWLDQGRLVRDGEPAAVIAAYSSFMNTDALTATADVAAEVSQNAGANDAADAHADAAADAAPAQEVAEASQQREFSAVAPVGIAAGGARLQSVTVRVDGNAGRRVAVRSGHSEVCVEVDFVSDPAIPPPSVAAAVTQMDGRIVCSAGTHNDGVVLERDAEGRSWVRLCFPRIPILKGTYGVNVYLLCERGIHCYERAIMVAELNVTQAGLEQGVVSLPHRWEALEERILASVG